MKTAQIVGRILAWINLVFWGIPIVSFLLGAMVSFNMTLVVPVVLLAAIPLHSYAALQLQKSLRRPEIKLSQQTPAGIRFVGLIALFIGILIVFLGAAVLGVAKEMLPQLKEQLAELKQGNMSSMTVSDLRQLAVLYVLLGLAIVASVLLHMRLLRWYYLVKQSDVS
jgi:hypothetical protein